jgi:hypothetical protein
MQKKQFWSEILNFESARAEFFKAINKLSIMSLLSARIALSQYFSEDFSNGFPIIVKMRCFCADPTSAPPASFRWPSVA